MAAIDVLYTTPSGPGLTTAQRFPNSSLGAFASTTVWTGGVLADLFNQSSSADAAGARTDYRCLYVYNTSYDETLADVRAFVTANTAAAAYAGIGLDVRPVTAVDSLSVQAVDIASAYAAPAAVTFSAPTDYVGGLTVGTLPPRSGRAVWVARRALDSVDRAAESFDVTITDNTSVTIVRRVVWQTENVATLTIPYAVPTYTPSQQIDPTTHTQNPFRRLFVDYLTAGSARITWAFVTSFADAGPYTFQLQASQSGIITGDHQDWTDVGTATRGAPAYLVDTVQRMYGVSTTLHYRIALTTADNFYYSEPASADGILSWGQWLNAREIIRKEQLMLRRLTGSRGFLLKAKRYGDRCTVCTDAYTGEIGNSSCTVCYGTGFVDGYHDPFALAYANTGLSNTIEKVAYNEGRGTIKDVAISARMIAYLPIVRRDVWVSETDDVRYYVGAVKEGAVIQSVPILFDVELHEASRSDIIYQLPITRPTSVPPVPAYSHVEVITI